jgi:Na+-transporting NADH:ubiquinone oxidoreductase subunit A
MSQFIKLKRGFDINLAGKASNKVENPTQPEKFAIKPFDFMGLKRPKLLVEIGDKVQAGQPLMYDKMFEGVNYVSPVSGEVLDIVRGKKRVLLEIVIKSDNEFKCLQFKKYSVSDINNLDRQTIIEAMSKTGVWPNMIQRPFGIVADPKTEPKSIFISGFDSHPLAPDYGVLLKDHQKELQAGINVLRKLTSGLIHFNVNGSGEMPTVYSALNNIQLNKFTGPHPVGNVGVQIHHIDPISKGDIVWTVNPVGVVQIGTLFLEGIYDASKLVAFVGSEVAEPKYYKTYSGACIDTIARENIRNSHVRFVSGNALTGKRIEPAGFLGFYDHMITVLPEGDKAEFLGWITPTFQKLSFQRAFGLLSFLNSKKEFALSTNARGEPRAFVQTGVFEKVTPMDIFPLYLVKAIMAEDFDDMEALGIYEVIEEDLALCEFVDVSKHDIQDILRQGIELIQTS